MDRKIAPAFRQVENIELIRPLKHVLPNGIEIFTIDAGDQELCRIEFIYQNVNWDAAKPLQAQAVNTMLNDGTGKLKASEIAGRVDYYGAFIQMEHSVDQSSVVLYTLNKHLRSVLPVVREVITDSIFPGQELKTFKRNQKQKLLVSLEKNDVVARRAFSYALFGTTPYGFPVQAGDYDRLTREDLQHYFKKCYRPKNCTIMIAGRVTGDMIDAIGEYFGSDADSGAPARKNNFTFSKGAGQEHYVEKPGALQSAIRIGQLSVNRTHADFPGLQVLNTILGGYFGSRLMANIREDKGYTYGIGSGLASMQHAGYFFISSEVGAEVCSAAVNEIQKEITLLKEEPVGGEELGLVRNYILGSFLGGLENAFSHADKFKNIHFFGLDYDYYDRYLEVIKTISPHELLRLANEYLRFEDMEKVIVGKR
ncbi:M16 family metallopeptidase [Hufsiella ginkgonis]|uniref:Insulinase family protein n=1 Tax=Hufsiella ginkgonis TaxID=2695274 RepID=A0A7K1XZH7_9SPHI|nr:pitrilysin family protein [Hufsiella ginkgonis]MXV15946.1 insulinase family protein [Hufsiella ginkgonis]